MENVSYGFMRHPPHGCAYIGGPTGSEGPTGPAGTIESGLELFNVTNQSSEEPVTFEGGLGIASDTLNISLESGPVVKIEKPYGIGTVIPFSSGTQLRINTATGGGRSQLAMVGFGIGAPLIAEHDPIILPPFLAVEETAQMDFSVPANGTITAFSAFFTAMSGGLALVDHHVTAQLYRAVDPEAEEFHAIEESRIEFDIITGSVLPTVRRQALLSDLDIAVAAHSRLLVVYSTRTPSYSASTYLLGYMSGSIEIR